MNETPLPELPASTRRYIGDAEIALRYDRFFTGNALFGFDTALLDAELTEPGTLLDLGCGTGRHVLHFARRGFSVTGVDLSDHMLAEARVKIAAAGETARLIKGDIRRLDWAPSGSFASAICMFSTYGMIAGRVQRIAFLNCARRALKPQGRLIVHVHNRFANARYLDGLLWLAQTYTVGRLMGWEVGDRRLSNYRGIRNMYLHTFSARELAGELEDGGFDVRQIVYLNGRRDAALNGQWLKPLRCNGYIAIAQARDTTALAP